MVECSMLLYASKRQSSICHHNGNSKARHAYLSTCGHFGYFPFLLLSNMEKKQSGERGRGGRRKFFLIFTQIDLKRDQGREEEEGGGGDRRWKTLLLLPPRNITVHVRIRMCGDGGGKFTMCKAGTFMRICWPAVRSRAKAADAVSRETLESTLISIKQN